MGSKILIIGPSPPPYGGVSVHLDVLKKHFFREGFQFRQVYMYRSNPFLALRETCMYVVYLFWADVVYDNAPFQHYPFFAWLFAAIARIFGKRYVAHLHSGRFTMPSGLRGLFQRIYFRLSTVIIVGKKEHEKLLERFGKPVYRIYSLFNIDFPDASVLPERVREFVDTHKPIVLSVGGMNETYSFHIVAEAFAGIRKNFPNAGLILVYGTSSFDRNYYEKLLQIIRDHGMESDVLLLEDFPHTNALYPLADVFVRATTHDSTPLSIYEAAAAGCKVLASDVVERPDFVETFGLNVSPLRSLLHRAIVSRSL